MRLCIVALDVSTEEKACVERCTLRNIEENLKQKPKRTQTKLLMNWKKHQKFLLTVAMKKTLSGGKRSLSLFIIIICELV